MSHEDEARYGRTCLLLLNICPFTLRHVINDYYTKHGFTSLQDFLEKNKHAIYHLLNKRCCCRLIQSRVIPMHRSQWDLLLINNSSACRTGYTGDCPCQYDAKPGITSDVMDITLSGLFIKNICSKHPGFNMSHIDTIRAIRNNIIHAESAALDVRHYNGYWNQVKTALLDLAKHVSSTVHADTLTMMQELDTRVMNAGELGEIRKVIVDLKRIEVVEENVSEVKKDLDKTSKRMDCIKGDVSHLTGIVRYLEGNMSQLEVNVCQVEGNMSHLEGKIRHLEGNMSHLEGNVNQFEGHVTHLKEDVSQIGENVSQFEGHVTHLKEDVSRIGENVSQLGDNVNQLGENENQLEGNVNQRFSQIEGNVSQTAFDMTNLNVALNQRTETSERKISKLEDNIDVQDQKIKQISQELKARGDKAPAWSDGEPDVSRLKQRLIKINHDKTECVTLSPLQEKGKELPIDLLFAQVVIRKDKNYTETDDNDDNRLDTDSNSNEDYNWLDYESYSDEDDNRLDFGYYCPSNEKLIHPRDIFKLDDDICNNIYMLGDAAHGKTTYCSWILKKWCNSQNKDSLAWELDKWETALGSFDFVFLLQFRHVNPNRACVIDMICIQGTEGLSYCYTTCIII